MTDHDVTLAGKQAASLGQECLEETPVLCEPYYSVTPEEGMGALPPLCKVEAAFNCVAVHLPILATILLVMIALFITVDVMGRLLFHRPWVGITDLEVLFMCSVGFLAIAVPIVQRQSIQIDMLYGFFPPRIKRILYLFGCLVSLGVSAPLAYYATLEGWHWSRDSSILNIPEWPVVTLTGLGMGMCGIAFFFQVCHTVKAMWARREFGGILVAFLAACTLACLPFLYKASGANLSGLVLGGVAFLILMTIMLLRVPLGFAMCAIGVLGILALTRTTGGAFRSVAGTPFIHLTSFILIAFPMFMLMGDTVALAGLSDDLFDAAKKWMGRLPGGLAVATVGGCAGFGAVCGESMVTVITMSAVAMPAMQSNGYAPSLSGGALAAGGTLGILIPPSMGFIVYSMITEESVGKLFVAGILPGLLLAGIFMTIIVITVARNPSLAPKAPVYPMKEKLVSLLKLVPVILLFLVVVMGILYGWYTPAEGGALGAVLSALYAAARGRLNWPLLKHTMIRSTTIFGKVFALLVGVYVLGSFLAASRLPSMLAETVAALSVSKYWVLGAIVLLYIFLGCVMNIIPMMLLTLPSLYPTVQALGFDSVWFGVVTVILMEMGMITPPVGMYVFTLSGLFPEIPMSTIFRGVVPFFFGMLLCLLLLVLFPQIALFLVP